MGKPCRAPSQPLVLKLAYLLSARPVSKRMPWQEVMISLTPTGNALSSPFPVREALQSLTPRPHGPFSKDSSTAVLGGGSAGAAWHCSCLPRQTPHPARKASALCSFAVQISPLPPWLGSSQVFTVTSSCSCHGVVVS